MNIELAITMLGGAVIMLGLALILRIIRELI